MHRGLVPGAAAGFIYIQENIPEINNISSQKQHISIKANPGAKRFGYFFESE